MKVHITWQDGIKPFFEKHQTIDNVVKVRPLFADKPEYGLYIKTTSMEHAFQLSAIEKWKTEP